MTNRPTFDPVSRHSIDTSDRRWVTVEITLGPFPEPITWENAYANILTDAVDGLVHEMVLPPGCDPHISAQLGRPDWAETATGKTESVPIPDGTIVAR